MGGQAAPLRLLLDTSAFLYLALDDRRLSPQARSAVQDVHAEVYLSAISVWEVAAKHRLGKLRLGEPLERFFQIICRDLALLRLPFTEEAALEASTLPNVHGDPFDRMLICQAMVHGCSIVTPDEAISQYPVHTIW